LAWLCQRCKKNAWGGVGALGEQALG
jgi:hypothetical protein